MADRWRPMLAVFLATCVTAGGVVAVVLTQQAGDAPGAEVVRHTTARSSPARTARHSATPGPTLTVDSGCRLGAGPTRLPDVTAQTTQRMDAAWGRIEAWLAVHAPASAATLAPPATDERIAKTQRQIGVPLPAELVASLRRHDGVVAGRATFDLPPFYRLMSAESISAQATMMCEVLTSLGEDSAVGHWWHGQFVPVGDDGGGANLLLDQRAGVGRLGQHYEDGDVDFERWPASLTELLGETADLLDGTLPQFQHRRPSVADGVLTWDLVR